MLNGIDADEATRKLQYVRPGEPGHEEYEAAYKNIALQFELYLHSVYLEQFPVEIADIVYQKAYEDGHASGYSEIETWYQEEAEFLRKVFRTLTAYGNDDLTAVIEALKFSAK